jgi:hypothetical protein
LKLLITYGPGVAAELYNLAVTRGPFISVPLFQAIFAVEIIVNAFFCNEFCQHNQLNRLLAWATAHQSENITPPVRSLQKVAWGGWALCCLSFAFFGVPDSLSDVPVSLSMSLAIALWFYVCLVWCWMNWVLHTTAQHWVQHRLDADGVLGVGGRDVGKELWEILEHMKAVSSVWGTNHAVRLVTSTGVATTLLMTAEYERHCDNAAADSNCFKGDALPHFATAALLYTLVWLTAAVPGYINDMLFSNIHRKLYTMCPEPDADPADGQLPPTPVLPVLTRHQRQSHPMTALEAKTTALMHRAHYLQGREGMHFAFVPMSLARAVTIGTVLGYTIVFATRTAK